jgi:hypothetical protein
MTSRPQTFPRDQHFFMLRSEQQLAHFSQQPWVSLRRRAFLADAVPAHIAPTAVKALCIEDVFAHETDAVDIPSSLHRFPRLAYLRLPKKYVSSLRQGDIPSSVQVLEIIDTGAATFPAHISLPQVRQLAGIPTVLKFTPHTFPQLRHLVLRLDRQRTMLARLADFDSLETLAMTPNHDNAVFAAVSPARLTALTLGGGSLKTLNGIERLQQLVSVGLSGMNSLETIEALLKLPKLAEVSIAYCANLAQYDALLQIATLERLTIFGCKRFERNLYRPRLEELHLKMLSLPF